MAYLKSKKFGKSEIAQMVSRAPYLLLFSVERLDNRLGFFKNELGLSVKKVKTEVFRYFVSDSCKVLQYEYSKCLEVINKHCVIISNVTRGVQEGNMVLTVCGSDMDP